MTSDLTPAELERVLKAHGSPTQAYVGRGMAPKCRQCPFETYPCLALRMAEEVQRRREAAGKQGVLL